MFSRTASVCPNVSSFIWVLIISAIVFSFYWWVMAKKFSLQIGIVISAVALAITCLMFVTLKSNSSRFLILLSLLLWAFGTTGLCFNTEALSIETMSIINLTWGDTGEGALSALTSLIAKITFVLGIAIASYILYSQKLDSMLVVMGKVDLSLFINLAIVSIVIAALNVWIALSYPLKGKKKDQLNKWIALRKEGKDNPLLASTLRKALARDPDYERKPLGCLYFFAGLYQMILTKIKFNTKIKRCRVKKPAIILSNHSSNHDYKFIEAAVWPKRINFLSTYYWFTFEHLRPWLQRIGAIPKLQFTTDINAIRKMRWVLKKNKGIIYIAPEGTVYANGHLCYISPAIIKIIRNFGVNVYSTTIKGASISCGKWEKVPAKGLVEIEMKPLFKANEIETLSDDELYNGIINALDYNEFDFQEEKGFKIKGDHKAEGIDDLLFICPKCKKEFTLSATGDEITCSNCGFKTTINDDFHFVYDKGEKYFENYALWYDWQLEKYYKIIKESGWSFTDKVDYYIDIKDTDGYVKGGTGTLTVDEKGWTYKGTLKGKEVVEKDDLKSVFVAIMKMGQHIELPYKDGHSRCFCFTENGKYSIKWHVISRAINKVLREQEE